MDVVGQVSAYDAIEKRLIGIVDSGYWLGWRFESCLDLSSHAYDFGPAKLMILNFNDQKVNLPMRRTDRLTHARKPFPRPA